MPEIQNNKRIFNEIDNASQGIIIEERQEIIAKSRGILGTKQVRSRDILKQNKTSKI